MKLMCLAHSGDSTNTSLVFLCINIGYLVLLHRSLQNLVALNNDHSFFFPIVSMGQEFWRLPTIYFRPRYFMRFQSDVDEAHLEGWRVCTDKWVPLHVGISELLTCPWQLASPRNYNTFYDNLKSHTPLYLQYHNVHTISLSAML